MIFKIIYTPLHGTGNRPVRKGLELIGFKHVQVVKEQEMLNPDFSTVAYPNPEEPAAFTLVKEYGENMVQIFYLLQTRTQIVLGLLSRMRQAISY